MDRLAEREVQNRLYSEKFRYEQAAAAAKPERP